MSAQGRRSKHNTLVNESSASSYGCVPTFLHISPQQGGQGAEELLGKLARTPDNDTVASRTSCTISYTSHYVEAPRVERMRENQTTVATGRLSAPPTPLLAIPYSCEAWQCSTVKQARHPAEIRRVPPGNCPAVRRRDRHKLLRHLTAAGRLLLET